MKIRILLFAVIGALLSWVSAHSIFLGVPTGSDENSYFFQANSFADGVISRDAPPFHDRFKQYMVILDDEAGWLSRYPPAHPLWLAPARWFGSVYVLTALAAALGVAFLCAAGLALGIPPLILALTLLPSPYFVFMYGTALSHTSGFMAVSILLWAYIRWQKGSGARFAVFAGLAWSFFFLNRTYTALLMAVPLGMDALWQLSRSRTRKSFIGTTAFALSAAIGVAVYLLYNKLACGDAFTATYLYYEPSENLGFGLRRTQGDAAVLHTLPIGLATLWDHIKTLDLWWWGFRGSLVAATALAIIGWSRRWSALLLSSMLAVCLGYVAFWYPGVANAGGPVYYFETATALALLTALGIARLYRALERTPQARRLLSFCFALALLGAASHFIADQTPRFIAQQMPRYIFWRTLDSAPPHFIVFVSRQPGVHKGEYARNPRGLDSNPLVLQSRGEYDAVAMRVFSNRTPLLLSGDDPTHLHPLTSPTTLLFKRDATQTGHRIGQNEAIDQRSNQWARVARHDRDKKDWLVLDRPVELPAGQYQLTIAGDYENIAPTHPSHVGIRIGDTNDVIALTGSHTGATPIATYTVSLTNLVTSTVISLRYGGTGTLRVRDFTWAEIPEKMEP